MKYALVTGQVRWSQGTVQLTRGKSADDDHPLVIERPDLFSNEAPDAELSAAPPVERATAAPGEKRLTPRKTAAKAAPRTGTTSEKGGGGE